MNQYEDGKDKTVNLKQVDTGKMLLTLCRNSSTDPYIHATIPFAESYDIAYHQAHLVFAADLKNSDQSLWLRHGTRRIDGSYVWSKITPETWNALERNGEEIGVFTSESDSAPYIPKLSPTLKSGSLRRPGFNMVRMHRGQASAPLINTDSLDAVRKAAFEYFRSARKVPWASGVVIHAIGSKESGPIEEIANSDALKYFLEVLPQPLDVEVTL